MGTVRVCALSVHQPGVCVCIPALLRERRDRRPGARSGGLESREHDRRHLRRTPRTTDRRRLRSHRAEKAVAWRDRTSHVGELHAALVCDAGGTGWPAGRRRPAPGHRPGDLLPVHRGVSQRDAGLDRHTRARRRAFRARYRNRQPGHAHSHARDAVRCRTAGVRNDASGASSRMLRCSVWTPPGTSTAVSPDQWPVCGS